METPAFIPHPTPAQRLVNARKAERYLKQWKPVKRWIREGQPTGTEFVRGMLFYGAVMHVAATGALPPDWDKKVLTLHANLEME